MENFCQGLLFYSFVHLAIQIGLSIFLNKPGVDEEWECLLTQAVMVRFVIGCDSIILFYLFFFVSTCASILSFALEIIRIKYSKYITFREIVIATGIII